MILAGAYYLAVKIIDPTTAMLVFFLAVVMVIIATYLLFIAGSVALCIFVTDGLPNEEKRSGSGVDLYFIYDGACDDLVYDVYLCRYGIVDQKPLST